MLDALSITLMIVGGAVTYGSKYLVNLLNLKDDGGKNIKIKLIGLAIAAVGCLRVLQVI